MTIAIKKRSRRRILSASLKIPIYMTIPSIENITVREWNWNRIFFLQPHWKGRTHIRNHCKTIHLNMDTESREFCRHGFRRRRCGCVRASEQQQRQIYICVKTISQIICFVVAVVDVVGIQFIYRWRGEERRDQAESKQGKSKTNFNHQNTNYRMHTNTFLSFLFIHSMWQSNHQMWFYSDRNVLCCAVLYILFIFRYIYPKWHGMACWK